MKKNMQGEVNSEWKFLNEMGKKNLKEEKI